MAEPKLPGRLPSKGEKRSGPADTFWEENKKPFLKAAIGASVMLQVLLLANLSYMYGSLFESGQRTHNLNVLMVDFDQSNIGQSLRQAYAQLEGQSFPTLVERSASEFPDVASLMDAVWDGDYWGAVYTHANATARLTDAITDGQAAASYNSSAAVTYIINEARYATVSTGSVASSLQRLISGTTAAYNQIFGAGGVNSVDAEESDSIRALLNPITASSINLKPTVQGARVLFNTATMVLTIIVQFFFTMALNGISTNLEFYTRLPFSTNLKIRLAFETMFTFLGGLVASGCIWAFREDWDVNGNQFVLTWMILWLYMHINFKVMDCVSTFVPISFLPFFVLTWAILNVSSTIFPFELSPGFYRWGYALPAHETWTVLMTIWTGGAINRLYIALPVLFAWEALLIPLSILCLHFRLAKALKAATSAQEQAKLASDDSDAEASHENTAEPATPRQRPQRPPRPRPDSMLYLNGEEKDYYPKLAMPIQQTFVRLSSKNRWSL